MSNEVKVGAMTEDEAMNAASKELDAIRFGPLTKATMEGHGDYNHVLARLNMVTTLVLAAQLKRLHAEQGQIRSKES